MFTPKTRLPALLFLLASCAGPSFQQPDGSFALKSRADILDTEAHEQEEALVVSPEPASVHFAPDAASKELGKLPTGQLIVITSHVFKEGDPAPWSLVKAGSLEGYVANESIDGFYRKNTSLALVRSTGPEAGTPLVAQAVLERNFQLADASLIRRDDVVLFAQPAFLEDDASWQVVGASTKAYRRFFDRTTEITLPVGTKGRVVGVSELPADAKAVLTPFEVPALVRIDDGTLVFAPLGSLLLHPHVWRDGIVGSRAVVRFQIKDAYQGRYGRLEQWTKDGASLVFEADNQPGDIALVEPRTGPADVSLKVVRRLTARTAAHSPETPSPAEAVVEDWYHPDPAIDAPWGMIAFQSVRSLSFSSWNEGVEETYELTLSGLADRFSDSAELLGTYRVSTWVPPAEEPEYSEEGGEGESVAEKEPPAENREFSGSLTFALTVKHSDEGFAVSGESKFTDVDLPESLKPESSSEFYDTIFSALNRAVEDESVSLHLFPLWFP